MGVSVPDIITCAMFQIAVILEFYFRFRFLPYYCHWHVVLPWPTKFHPSWNIHDILKRGKRDYVRDINTHARFWWGFSISRWSVTFLWVTISQGVEFFIFLLIFEWDWQHSALIRCLWKREWICRTLCAQGKANKPVETIADKQTAVKKDKKVWRLHNSGQKQLPVTYLMVMRKLPISVCADKLHCVSEKSSHL